MAKSLFACNNLGTALAITIINSVKNSFLLTQSPCLYLRGHTLDNWEGALHKHGSGKSIIPDPLITGYKTVKNIRTVTENCLFRHSRLSS